MSQKSREKGQGTIGTGHSMQKKRCYTKICRRKNSRRQKMDRCYHWMNLA